MCPLFIWGSAIKHSKKQKKSSTILLSFHFPFLLLHFFLLIRFHSIGMEWRTAIIHTTTPSSLLHTFNHFTLLFIFNILNVKKKDEHYHAQQIPLFSLSTLFTIIACSYLWCLVNTQTEEPSFFLSSYFSFLFSDTR